MVEVRGIGVSPGIAIGRVSLIDRRRLKVAKYHVGRRGVERELSRFDGAHSTSVEQLAQIVRNIEDAQGEDHYHVVEAHKMMLEDEVFVAEVRSFIEREEINAEWAIRKAVRKFKQVFDRLVASEYLEERRTDVDFVGERILRNLQGEDMMSLPQVAGDSIAVAHDFGPADTAMLAHGQILGFVTEVGGPTSHTAIVARDLELPAVVGAEEITDVAGDGDEVIIDGSQGVVIISPDAETVARYRARRTRWLAYEEGLLETRDEPAITQDGERVLVKANIELVDELRAVLDHGAEGIGLYRTEYLYVGRDALPDEDAHYDSYREVVERMHPHPVTVRTIDVGGDKRVPMLGLTEEMNPALGMRAIRYCLGNEELFLTQLRGLLRASAHGEIRIMFPMVSGIEELHAAKAFVDTAKAQLRDRGIAFDEEVAIGIMMELPSACMIADLLAPEVDFFSLGTNDLIQFVMAADRTNEHVAYLYQPFHPGVLRLVDRVIQAARDAGIHVSMCGEMASETTMAPILLAMGLRDLSMNAHSIPVIKAIMRDLALDECQALYDRARSLSGTSEIAALVRAWMTQRFPQHFS